MGVLGLALYQRDNKVHRQLEFLYNSQYLDKENTIKKLSSVWLLRNPKA